jgi:peptide/nickel transport system substrate-binding protein
MYPALQSFYVAMVFNHQHPILRHVDVRRALVEALDKRQIIERGMRGHGREADSPVWPMHWAYAPPTDRYSHDPESARKRLDAAGLRLPAGGKAGELRSRFKFKCLVYEDPQYERIALMVQRQLLEIGVDMSIELVGLDAFEPLASSGDFDAFLMRANAGRSLDFSYRLWRSPGPDQMTLQRTGYSGADHLLDALRRSTSDDEMRATVAALVQKFHQDAPAAFIAWLEVTRAVDSSFSVGGSTGEDPLTNIGEWRPKDRNPVP